MSLVMRNNRMCFGDLVVHQIKGIAMGMSPAPAIANLFVAIFEAEQIVPIIGTFIMFLC
jgi:tetrahydromethanopterin S-methyltransferase subunit F